MGRGTGDAEADRDGGKVGWGHTYSLAYFTNTTTHPTASHPPTCERVDLVEENHARRVVARHLEQQPHETLRVAAPLGRQRRRGDVEEGSAALRGDGLGEQRLARACASGWTRRSRGCAARAAVARGPHPRTPPSPSTSGSTRRVTAYADTPHAPGGPNSSTPRQGRRMPVKYPGMSIGSTTASATRPFAACSPAMASNVTAGRPSSMSASIASASSRSAESACTSENLGRGAGGPSPLDPPTASRSPVLTPAAAGGGGGARRRLPRSPSPPRRR